VGLETGSSSSLGSFRDRLPRERYRGSVGLGGFWGLAPRDRACARRKARGRGCFRAMREGGEVFAFNARSGTIPLPLGRFWGQVAPAR
jgi:hypothetical protein